MNNMSVQILRIFVNGDQVLAGGVWYCDGGTVIKTTFNNSAVSMLSLYS